MNGIFLLLNWNLHFADHPFIHTKSALAFQGSNQDLSESLHGRNLVSTKETPFDSYWAATSKNMEHVSLFDSGLFTWLINEIEGKPNYPCSPLYYTREIAQTQFVLTTCYAIVLNAQIISTRRGDTVFPGDFTVTANKVEMSNVRVGNNSKLQINAGDIILDNGFEVNLGGELTINPVE